MSWPERAEGCRDAQEAPVQGSLIEGVVRTLLDASPNAVVAVDATGTIRYVNGRVQDAFGYRPDELIGRPIEVLVPDRLARRHEHLRAAFTADPQARPLGTGLDLAGRRKDGSEFPFEISLTPVPTGEGVWVVAAVVDVTARHSADSRIRSLSRAYLTLAQANQAIVRVRDATALYAAICRIAVEQGGYLGAWVGRADAVGKVIAVATAGRLDEYVAQLQITLDPASPGGQGPAASTLRRELPHYVPDFMADRITAPWHELGRRYGIRASATMPLRCGGSTIAALTLYSSEPNIFDADMRSLLEGMADNVSFALEGLEAEQELRRVAAQRSELLSRLVAAQEGERARIAADVHDDSVQALAAIDLRLGLLHRKVREVAPELDAMFDQLQATLAGATERLRELLFDLEPAQPGMALLDALREAAAHIFEETGVTCTVAGDGDLPDAERGQAVRIAKQALTNARQHAHATAVTVTVRPVAGGVEIAVIDDGIGVDPVTVASAPGHRGLTTMTDRAEIAGGWFRLERNPGRGATSRFWLPGRPPGDPCADSGPSDAGRRSPSVGDQS